MTIEGEKYVTKIVDKQFEIIGIPMKFSDIPEDGIVSYKEGKKEKKDHWFNVYKFTSDQETEWKKWALSELSKKFNNAEDILREIEMRYGFSIRYKKERELF